MHFEVFDNECKAEPMVLETTEQVLPTAYGLQLTPLSLQKLVGVTLPKALVRDIALRRSLRRTMLPSLCNVMCQCCMI